MADSASAIEPVVPSTPLVLAASYVDIDKLIPYARNSRQHDDTQISALAAAIVEYGFTNPVLADEQGIVAGHGRVMAARKLYESGKSIALPNGVEIPKNTVPVLDCTGWSDARRKAYVIWDNKSAELSSWDFELLAVEFQELKGLDFDLSFTGFDLDEIQGIIDNPTGAETLAENYSRKIEAPIYRITGEKPAVSALADETKTNQLKAEVAAANLPDDVRAFLVSAAERHTVFNFQNIAEFYAHADAPLQRLMEKSALVIIDFDKAIENGFVRLSEGMMAQADLAKAAKEEKKDAQ